jgi:hypothetical protein
MELDELEPVTSEALDGDAIVAELARTQSLFIDEVQWWEADEVEYRVPNRRHRATMPGRQPWNPGGLRTGLPRRARGAAADRSAPIGSWRAMSAARTTPRAADRLLGALRRASDARSQDIRGLSDEVRLAESTMVERISAAETIRRAVGNLQRCSSTRSEFLAV